MTKLHSIVVHWTGGGYEPNAVDLAAYHVLIDGEGRAIPGTHKPEANLSTRDGVYAAHFGGGNTGRIGIAVCCMRGAREAPFDAGTAPMREVQWKGLIREIAALCDTYEIEVGPDTVFTHAEKHGHRGKWDITWTPGETGPRPARDVGDMLRARVKTQRAFAGVRAKQAAQEAARAAPATAPAPSWLARLVAALRRRLGIGGTAAVLTGMLWAAPADASPACGPRDRIADYLSGAGETQVAVGLTGERMAELWVAPDGGWTWLVSSASGIACVAGVGTNWWPAPPLEHDAAR